MKNSIIWSVSKHESLAESFWNTFGLPYILTTFSEDGFDYYFNRDEFPIFLEGLHGLPKLDKKWELKVKPLHGEDWMLFQPKNLESFIDLLRMMNHSEDIILMFSNDLNVNELKAWMERKEQEQFKINKVLLPDVEFEENPELITSFSQCTILHGFLSYYDNYDYLIVSNDTKSLEQIMQSAEQTGEPRLPDYTDSLSFKKSYDDSAIFFTDLDLVIKNRLKYKD